jgi:tight adherence protein B
MVILLALSLFLLFYFLFLKDAGAGKIESGIKSWFKRFALPTVFAVAAFLLGTLVCRTPLAGVIWAVLFWFVPDWAGGFIAERRKSALRGGVKNFIAAAASLYAAGQVTPEVIRIASQRFPEPLRGDFNIMLGRRNTDSRASFPGMFEELSEKYGLPEFKALAAIVAASERAGGPRAAAEGLKQLSAALRSRDRLLHERRKETLEPVIAAGVAIILISLGFLLDVTLLSRLVFSAPGGKIALSIVSLLILIMFLAIMKGVTSQDLARGA